MAAEKEEMLFCLIITPKSNLRKSGTGGIYQITDHLFEGRSTPTNAQGKREVHTVYAKTKEECEGLVEKMIAEVRERIKEEKRGMKTESMTESRVSS